ncbi:polysaccharide deacetylase family protein [Paenibacillus macquariensis]|nr:polysaccharide deacetylase family protein [Paenibacillus macquariensis]
MTPRPLSQFQKQIVTTDAIIHYIFGYNPRLIRPPYGDITEEQMKWLRNKATKSLIGM